MIRVPFCELQPMKIHLITLFVACFVSCTPVLAAPSASVQVSGAVVHAQTWTTDQLKTTFASQITSLNYTLKGQAHTAHVIPLLTVIDQASPRAESQDQEPSDSVRGRGDRAGRLRRRFQFGGTAAGDRAPGGMDRARRRQPAVSERGRSRLASLAGRSKAVPVGAWSGDHPCSGFGERAGKMILFPSFPKGGEFFALLLFQCQQPDVVRAHGKLNLRLPCLVHSNIRQLLGFARGGRL